jgi:hypothetical protein
MPQFFRAQRVLEANMRETKSTGVFSIFFWKKGKKINRKTLKEEAKYLLGDDWVWSLKLGT